MVKRVLDASMYDQSLALRRPPGRPGYLTPEVEALFLKALVKGNSQRDAAIACGLRPGTVEKWWQRGRGIGDRPATPEYKRFSRLVEQAMAIGRMKVVSNVHDRTEMSDAAAANWLRVHGGPEWRDNQQFVPEIPPVSTQNTVIDNREQQVNVLMLGGEDIEEAVRLILAKKRAGRTDVPVSDAVEEPHDGPSGTRDSGLREDG